MLGRGWWRSTSVDVRWKLSARMTVGHSLVNLACTACQGALFLWLQLPIWCPWNAGRAARAANSTVRCRPECYPAGLATRSTVRRSPECCPASLSHECCECRAGFGTSSYLCQHHGDTSVDAAPLVNDLLRRPPARANA